MLEQQQHRQSTSASEQNKKESHNNKKKDSHPIWFFCCYCCKTKGCHHNNTLSDHWAFTADHSACMSSSICINISTSAGEHEPLSSCKVLPAAADSFSWFLLLLLLLLPCWAKNRPLCDHWTGRTKR